MKIAMIGQKGVPATWGGVERHVEELAAALADLGVDITVYARAHYSDTRGDYRGFNVINLSSLPTIRLDAISHSLISTLNAITRDFDIIHYHGIGPALPSPIARIAGKKSVLTVHALDWRRAKWGTIARRILRLGESVGCNTADRVIAVSPVISEYLRCERRAENIFIPNGVPPPRFRQPGALADRLGLENMPYLLFLGRFVPEKGCHTLIRAFRQSHAEAKLIMAGEPMPGNPYFESIKRLGEGDERIIFPGGVYGEEKEEALSNALAVCLPSEVEGMSIVLLEAMSYARCVIASSIPENACVLNLSGKPLGMLFETGNERELRERIERAVAAPEEPKELGAEAAAYARGHFDWHAIARETLEVYQSISD